MDELADQADLLVLERRYAEAAELYRKALHCAEAALDPDHPDVGGLLHSLAILLVGLGQHSEADQLHERALTIFEKALGPDDLDVAQSLEAMAGLYDSLGRHTEAEALYRRALTILEKALGSDVARLLMVASLNNLAVLYEEQGRYDKAEPLSRRALAIREKALGPDDLDVAQSLDNLATLYVSQDRYSEAEPLLRRALTIREKAYGSNHPDVSESLGRLGAVYFTQGQYSKAESFVERALILEESTLGRNHPDVAPYLHCLAVIRDRLGRSSEAENLYRRALDSLEEVQEPDHLALSSGLEDLANLYETQGRYKDAEPLMKRALAIREKALGPDHPDVAQSLGNLAQLYLDLGQYPKAESLVKRSLAIGEKALGPDHPDVALSLSNLGAAYSGQGRFTQAEPLLKRALAIGEKVLGPDHVDVALFLSNLGAVYLQQGRFPQAEPVLKRALAIGEKALGPDHPEVAQSLGNLAISYDAQGQFDDAEPLLRRALSISEKALGSDHPDVAMYLSNLACLYVKQGRYSEADSLLGQALYRDVKTLGLAHPRMAGALTNLAVSYSTQGMYSVAGYLHEKALAIFEKALGPDHPYVAMALTNLAGLHLAGEEVREAEPLLRRALVIHVKALGPDHPHVAKSLEGLAVLEASLDRRRSALPLLQRALAIDELTIDNVFSLASERQKFEFLGTVANRLDMLLTLVVHQVPNNPVARQLPDNAEHLRRAADAVLRRKGLVLDALSMERTALLTSEDPEFGEAARRLHATASTLATMVLAGPAEMEAGAYRSRIDELQDERDGLEGQLAGLSMIYAARRQDHQVDASQVAAAIEPGAILVEYVRYRPWNFATPGIWMKWATPRYLTFVLGARHAAVPLLVDPGEAEPIDKAVHAFRQKMERSAVTIGRVGEAESERLLAERGRRLYDLVLAPLRASIGDAETIYLAPDGELNQIPFGVLQDEHGRYLSESYQLNYLSSGRDLLRLGPNRPPGSIVVVADPNYDLRRQEDDAGAPGDERPGPSEPESVPRSADLRSSGWARLPGTRAEAEGISMTLSGLGIDLFAGDGASEQVVKETRTPRVLHLATHGFFLEDQDRSDWLESAQSQRGLVLDGVSGLPHLPQLALENPLLRSGLVFAGANHLGKRPLDEGEDDGILTALEVSGMNLWGTDLVVLSACETGLGEVRTGEGVFGLRRAFQLAGARTVVMSLWSVPDEETVTLMTDFYRRMNAGVGKARALQEASLALMRERREKHGAAHPYYWGAFVSVGEP